MIYAAKIGVNYSPNENHSFGLTYNFGYKPSETNDKSLTDVLLNEVASGHVKDETLGDIHNRMHTLSGYYMGNVKNWSLAVNADVVWINEDRTQYVNEQASDDSRLFDTNNQVDSKLYAAKAEASHPLWKGDITLGAEGSMIRRSDIYTSLASFIANSDTELKEDNLAGYVEISQRIGKVMTSLGLRYEHSASKYYDQGVKQAEQSRNYDNLFPSAMIMMPIGKTRVRLSYSKKVTRPAFSQLSSTTYNTSTLYLPSRKPQPPAFFSRLPGACHFLQMAYVHARLHLYNRIYHVCIYAISRQSRNSTHPKAERQVFS